MKTDSYRESRLVLLLALAAVVLYLPGIGWGFPEGLGRQSWAADELGPYGPIDEIRNAFLGGIRGNPQYPLFHYMVLFLAYAPYRFLEIFIPNPANPHVFLLIARLVSLLMGVGTVLTAYYTAKVLWDRTTGILAGLFVMLMYPMFYYARTSNVDVPSLFWSSLVILWYTLSVKQRSLTPRRAVWLGVLAALAVATKDSSYGPLLPLAFVLLLVHLRNLRDAGQTDTWSRLKAPLLGALVSACLYLVASGFAIRPAKFLAHVAFIRGGASHYRFYFEYPATFSGYWGLWSETFSHMVDSLGPPLMLAALAGILICAVKDRFPLTLLLTVPALFLLVLAPVRYVELRYVIVLVFILACLAARGISFGLHSSSRVLRFAAILLLVFGCGLQLARGADLTYIMFRDSRHEATAWLAEHAHPGDRVEHFGKPRASAFFPRLPNGLQWLHSEVTPMPGKVKPTGEFVVAMGREDLENHWRCPEWVYRGLTDGTFGYELVADLQTRSLFSIHYRHFTVNPRIQIFARRDRAAHTLEKDARRN